MNELEKVQIDMKLEVVVLGVSDVDRAKAAEHHDHYEKTHAEHHWWDWYAPYLSGRQNGSSPEEAAAAADHYMEENG